MVAMSAVCNCWIISGQNCGVELLIWATWGEWDGVFEGGEVEAGQAGLEGLQRAGGDRCSRGRGVRRRRAMPWRGRFSMLRMFCASRRACSGRLPAKVSILVMWATYCWRSLMSCAPGAQVVVLLGQAEAALGDLGDLFGGVLEVLLFAVSEEGVGAVALQLAEEGGELGAAGGAAVERVDPVEHGLDGGEAFGLDEGGVHAGVEVVANLLLVGRAEAPPVSAFWRMVFSSWVLTL